MNEFSEYRAWKNWSEGTFGHHDALEATYFAAELSLAGVDLQRPQDMLEIGFGNGNMASWAKARGWNYAGTERNPQLLAVAQAAGIDARSSSEPLHGNFDIVVTFDVLEHLPLDVITALLLDVRKCLKPNGIFLARFPSGDSPFSRGIQHGDVTHMTAIGSSMVEQLCLKSGMQIVQVREPAFPLSNMGLSRFVRRAAVKLGRGLVTPILRRLYFDNDPSRILTSNMVIVLKKAKDDGSAVAAASEH